MKKNMFFLCIALMLHSCMIKEVHVKENRVAGLYKRTCFNDDEFLCLNSDHSYKYFLVIAGLEKTLNKGDWSFEEASGRSYLALKNFNFSITLNKYLNDSSGISVPVKYSFNRKAILLRMNPDAFSEDFVRIDSVSCAVKTDR